MPKTRKDRRPRRAAGRPSGPRAASPAAAPVPVLLGPRHAQALAGLAHPAPLTEADLARGVPDRCVVPARAVADTAAAAERVLHALGEHGLLASEIVDGLRRAARAGAAAELAPHQAKALWRFCDAFSHADPRLAAAARGLTIVTV